MASEYKHYDWKQLLMNDIANLTKHDAKSGYLYL